MILKLLLFTFWLWNLLRFFEPKMNKIFKMKIKKHKILSRFMSHSKMCLIKSLSILGQMEQFVNKYFIYYDCLLSIKDVVHKRKNQPRNDTKNEWITQKERYWYIKHLKIYRMPIVCLLFLHILYESMQ